MSDYHDLLLEIGTEELPPKALRSLSEALGEGVRAGLSKLHLGFDDIKVYASPRRLAVLVLRLASAQPHTVEERRGPALTAAFDGQGVPHPGRAGFRPLLWRRRRCVGDTGKRQGRVAGLSQGTAGLPYTRSAAGTGSSADCLTAGAAAHALGILTIPSCGPCTGLFCSTAMRFCLCACSDWRLGARPAAIDSIIPASYTCPSLLRTHRCWRPSAALPPIFFARLEAVRAQVLEAAVAAGGEAVIDEALLDEVTAMVEWPVATRRIRETLPQVPAEALISAMKGHQKYFHLVDGRGHLMPAFITVSNIDSTDKGIVQAGNERVIRPRLSDAMFFWAQDRRHALAARFSALEHVVFQRRLGTLQKKSVRVAALAATIARASAVMHSAPSARVTSRNVI